MDKKKWYRNIPKVDILLEQDCIQKMIEHYGRESVMEAIHIELDNLRKYIASCEDDAMAKEQADLQTLYAAIKESGKSVADVISSLK